MSQSKNAKNYIKFKRDQHDFGKIKQGSVVNFDFLFDNISDENVTKYHHRSGHDRDIPYLTVSGIWLENTGLRY